MSSKITMLLSTALLAAGLAVRPASAHAEDPSSPDAERGDVNTYDFEDDLVLGDTVEPDAEVLYARRHGSRESLVRPRLHFIPELLKSGEDL
ncbi:MAG: hypothetical protein ACHQ53_02105 [Polyangiales bacterium]